MIRLKTHQSCLDSMIDQTILCGVKNAVCAVGYLAVDLEKYALNPFERDYFRVVGSGFLIRDSTVITNRHVIEGMRYCLNKNRFPDDRRMVQFAYPRADGWQTAMCGVEFISTVDNEDIDVGFIDITRLPEKEFDQCVKLNLIDDRRLFVGQSVAMLGYPQGNDLFVNPTVDSQIVYRFGAVLQQGHISALAPFDIAPPYSRVLSDIRTCESMSGSPLFDPETGLVISLHTGSNKVTTAFSIPLYENQMNEWLDAHNTLRAKLS